MNPPGRGVEPFDAVLLEVTVLAGEQPALLNEELRERLVALASRARGAP